MSAVAPAKTTNGFAISHDPGHEERAREKALFDGCEYREGNLTIVVLGASGDLAKKKTYPALFEMYTMGFIPKHATIIGYARSAKCDQDFRASMDKALGDAESPDVKKAFLEILFYRQGGYDSDSDMAKVADEMAVIEKEKGLPFSNRLFYFAIPPTVFATIGGVIKRNAMIDESKGWNRLIIEKPFGHDLASYEELDKDLSAHFTEKEVYRIDHFLGKEIVQNLMVLRFANSVYEPLWNRQYIQSVTINFKEPFGTEGRGGYFDNFGIIRDVMQNHLLQVLCLVAMEPPVRVRGEGASNYVRDEKVKVLKAMSIPEPDDIVVGQYIADDKGEKPGYLDDEQVPKNSVTPTFATMVFYINNTRWQGVPFIMKAGKALNEKKAEIRIQFRPPPATASMFAGEEIKANNELVLRMQPKEAIYVKNNLKTPGLDYHVLVSELNLSYRERFKELVMPEAYTRLIIETLRGNQSGFVRGDELRAAWEIFTPILDKLEKSNVKPIPYKYGSRGPTESDELARRVGYQYHGQIYDWNKYASAKM